MDDDDNIQKLKFRIHLHVDDFHHADDHNNIFRVHGRSDYDLHVHDDGRAHVLHDYDAHGRVRDDENVLLRDGAHRKSEKYV